MAYRMQTSVPELTDLSKEPASTFDMYGPDARTPGHLRRQLPAGAPPGRARRAFHPALPHGLGSSRGRAAPIAAAVPAIPTSPRRRWSRI